MRTTTHSQQREVFLCRRVGCPYCGVTKRCRTLSGHNMVEGKGLQNYNLVMIHDDEYSFCVRHTGKLNEAYVQRSLYL